MPAPAERPAPRTGRPRMSLETSHRNLHIRLIARELPPSDEVETILDSFLDVLYEAIFSRPDIWTLVDVRVIAVRGDGAFSVYSSTEHPLDQLQLIPGILAGKFQGMRKMEAVALLGATSINVIDGTALIDSTSDLGLLDVASTNSVNFVVGSDDLEQIVVVHRKSGAKATVYSVSPSDLLPADLKHRLNTMVSRDPMDTDALVSAGDDRPPSVGILRA